MTNHIHTSSMSTPAPGALASAREQILTLHAQGISAELIASEVFTTIEHVMNVIVTAPDAALATAQPAVDTDPDYTLAVLQQCELLQNENRRLKQDCANLSEALQNLVGQVVQARDGFGIWPYTNSESMASAIEDAESAIARAL